MNYESQDIYNYKETHSMQTMRRKNTSHGQKEAEATLGGQNMTTHWTKHTMPQHKRNK